MFVVGGLCLIFYAIFEVKWAKFPSSPRQLLVNKTFMTVRPGPCALVEAASGS
jgi:hypothetical protein